MTASNFAASLKVILREEGGNDDDPEDHGGRTSRGIIQRVWDVYRKTHSGLPADVWKAPQSDIEAIYRQQYWDPWCDKLPSGVDLVYFDFCVNAGRSQATRTMQRAIGASPADGSMGMMTLDAINKASSETIIRSFSEKRREFYQALKQFPRYGKGWVARVNRVEATALKMAKATTKTTVASAASLHPAIDVRANEPDVTVSAKADATEVAEAPVSASTSATVATGSSVATGAADQLQGLSTAITPLSDTLAIVKYICIAVAVVSAGLMIYALIRNARNKKATGLATA